jgi:Leucine-rich repeat (LRR) protein
VSLHINSNNIESVPESAFWDLENLEFLDLGGNFIHFLHKNTLMYMKKLKTLYLYDNRLEYLDVKLFKNNIRLETISLNKNAISVIAGRFATLPSITKITMEGNVCI